MYSINSFSISRLTHAEITGFLINVQKAVQKADAESLGLETSLMTSYATTLQSLIDHVYISTASANTILMQTADTKRNQIYRRIRLRLEMVQYCDDNDDLTACKETVTTHLLNKYGVDVTKMAVNAKTGVLQGFIMDLNNKLTSDDRDALGIESDLSALDTANAEYIAAYNSRLQERSEGDTGVTVKLRSQMTDIYNQICNTVSYLANVIATDKQTVAKACQDFIGVLNVLLADVKKRYYQRINGTSENEEETTDTTETPVVTASPQVVEVDDEPAES